MRALSKQENTHSCRIYEVKKPWGKVLSVVWQHSGAKKDLIEPDGKLVFRAESENLSEIENLRDDFVAKSGLSTGSFNWRCTL